VPLCPDCGHVSYAQVTYCTNCDVKLLSSLDQEKSEFGIKPGFGNFLIFYWIWCAVIASLIFALKSYAQQHRGESAIWPFAGIFLIGIIEFVMIWRVICPKCGCRLLLSNDIWKLSYYTNCPRCHVRLC
jgi:hypothetical protein